MVALIDYDAGNLYSAEKALRALGCDPEVTSDPDIIIRADKVIVPGQGDFLDCMQNLERFGLIPVLKEVAARGTPYLGICVGHQLLFESSEEGMEKNGGKPVPGLGILKGKILRIPEFPGQKIPHMGWNSLSIRPGSRLLRGIPDGSYAYFVHSYYAEAEDGDDVAATTEYGVRIDAIVERGNVFGTQFHPEKSSATGLKILKNFLEL